jgi:hypothetical protein
MTDLSNPLNLFGRVRSVRAMLSESKPDDAIDHVDRALAAVALVAGAVIIIWPEGRGAPKMVAKSAVIGRAVWARRSWWLPVVTPRT